jgi:putative PIN family toxin of toxin-antitoxin system
MGFARVVLDANVIISALIRPDSAPGRVLRPAIESARCRMVTSRPLMAELRAALDYKGLQRYLKMDAGAKEVLVIMLEQVADHVRIDPLTVTGICRDPKDEIYLHTARAGHADYIVSGDDDLLTIRQFGPIKIVKSAEFEKIVCLKYL